MSKSTIAIISVLVLLSSSAWANPYASIGELARHGQVGGNAAAERDCSALQRDSNLRVRLRPSERRELIAQCKRANEVVRIAQSQPIEVSDR